MAENSIFLFESYQDFVSKNVGETGTRKGIRKRLSKFMNCQPSHLTQVLKGNQDLTLEQAEKAAEFFELYGEELEYFLLLVQSSRAGTNSLKNFFQKQIHKLKNKKLKVSNRIETKQEIPESIKAEYYSNWLNISVHMSLGIPYLNNPKALSEYFGVSINDINKTLDFLESNGLIKREIQGIRKTPLNIFIKNDSPYITNHHMNFRHKATDHIQRMSEDNLHYSAVASMSKKDAERIKDLFLELIKKNVEIIKDSDPEEMLGINIDFFNLKH